MTGSRGRGLLHRGRARQRVAHAASASILSRSGGAVVPRRDDLKKILVIGSGPIVIGQACEFDYSGAQACKVLRDDGFEVVLVNSNPATIMTDPELADRTYVEPITPTFVEKIIAAERPDAILPTLGGQTGLNCAVALADAGDTRALRRRAHRRDPRRHQEGRGPQALPRGDGADRARRAEERIRVLRARSRGHGCRARLPGRRAAIVHDGRCGRRHRLQRRGAARDLGRRRRALARRRGARRGERHRLERVRDGGHARPARQRGHRVLHRELRRHGRAHGRLDHRRAGSDAHGPRVPGHARCLDRDTSRDRRRDRRLERAVRGRSRRTAAWSSSR